jgi:hypothetical protein
MHKLWTSSAKTVQTSPHKYGELSSVYTARPKYLTSQVFFVRRDVPTYTLFLLAYEQVINWVFYLLNGPFSVLSTVPTNTTKLIKE